MTRGPSSSRSTTSASNERPVRSLVLAGHLRLAFHGGVHHRAGVDLAVRMGIGGADHGAPILEDQDVRHAVLRLQERRCGHATS